MITTADELREALRVRNPPRVRLSTALIELGLLDQRRLREAYEQAKSMPAASLSEALLSLGMITPAELKLAMARKVGVPLVDVRRFAVEPEALRLLPFKAAMRLSALPLTIFEDAVVVAVEDPTRQTVLDEVRTLTGRRTIPVMAVGGRIESVLKDRYFKGSAFTSEDTTLPAPLDGASDFPATDTGKLIETLERDGEGSTEEDDGPLIEQSDNSLVLLINQMIIEARTRGVSDVHIECQPGRERIRIRFRKDGILGPYLELPHNYRNAIVARIKIMCDLDISERRKPQDGKINFARFSPAHKIELRVATIPTSNGVEDVVMRILESAKPLPLEQIDLRPENLARLKGIAERPYGLVLCVGPTGSGKTTAIHALLAHINVPERKIWTAEDPVEITHPGLRQVQINPKIGWTFSKALRAFLRADPDVVMVGEVRDEETARMAVEASLTGHLVLSTLHTNSAAETVTRLLDMGMDPFSFGDSLLGVLAQRLVRRICRHCRQPRPATDEEVAMLLTDYLHDHPEGGTRKSRDAVYQDWVKRFGGGRRPLSYRSVGCVECDQSGYKGRIALHELLVVTPELRSLIQARSRSEAIKALALVNGMRTLRQDGIEKVLLGLVRVEDIRAASNA